MIIINIDKLGKEHEDNIMKIITSAKIDDQTIYIRIGNNFNYMDGNFTTKSLECLLKVREYIDVFVPKK